MAEIFQITDGTTTIDLLDKTKYFLQKWRPKIPRYKDGGIYQGSILSDQRRITDRRFSTVIETMTITIMGTDYDTVIANLRSLLVLIEQATNYWINGNSNIVYIIAQAETESNPRYASIIKGDIEELPDPFGIDAEVGIKIDGTAVGSGMVDVDLTIERRQWGNSAPGTSTVTEISATQSFNSRTLGRSATTAAEVFISGKHNQANLTHVYRYDSSLASFSSNLLDAAQPYKLFPDPAGNGDILYLGSSTAVSDSGPFSSIITDIETAAAGTYTLTWEIYTGSWSGLTTRDDTSNFKTTGVNGIFFAQSASWATTSINGVTAWWIRVRISAFTSMSPVPTQANRNIYSVVKNYVSIASDAVNGDIPALSRITIVNKAHQQSPSPSVASSMHRMMIGLRSSNRGTNFVSFLNASDEQNISGLTVAAPGISASFIDNTTTPTGRIVQWVTGGSASIGDRVTYTLDSTIAPDFYGEYRAFIITGQTIADGVISAAVGLQFGSAGTQFGTSPISTDPVGLNDNGEGAIHDLGTVKIIKPPYDVDEITISILASATGSETIDFWALVLIPTDEWAIDIFPPILEIDSPEAGIDAIRYLNMDCITSPRDDLLAMLPNIADDLVSGLDAYSGASQSILQSGLGQTLHFLPFIRDYATNRWSFITGFGMVIQVYQYAQYLALRGAG